MFNLLLDFMQVEEELYQEDLDRAQQISEEKSLSVLKLTELPGNILRGGITTYDFGGTAVKASDVFDAGSLLPKQEHCLNARPTSATMPQPGVCYLLVANADGGAERGVLEFRSEPYNVTVVVTVPGQPSGVSAGLAAAFVVFLLLAAVAGVAFVVWKKKKSGGEGYGLASLGNKDGPEPAGAASATTGLSGAAAADSRHRPLALEALVRTVAEPGFAAAAAEEYRRIEDLDQRFVAINQSQDVARSWLDKSNRSGNMNRYGNILPYDRKRVVLRAKVGGDCDYVNASWIRGFEGSK